MKKKYLLIAMAAVMTVPVANAADTQMEFSAPFSLSDAQTPDGGDAFKTKLVRLGNGALISVFGDGVTGSVDTTVYDLKGDAERPARDIFIRTCASATADCSIESNWSAPQNVSGTALLSSINTDWDGPEVDGATTKTYYGDSDKPNISNGGANIMVTWTDKYCGDGSNQRTVTYLTRENREIPFSCTWARKGSVNGGGVVTWEEAQQLSDGTRDAKQDVSKINLAGNSVITWQEDPLGLQIGAADGPGDGASGANASHGTDIWIATKTEANGYTGAIRLTDNYDGVQKASGNHNVIKAAGAEVEDESIDGGQASATRANTALVGPTIVVAYEETKGSEGLDIGKLVRYHTMPFSDVAAAVTAETADTELVDTGLNQAGCIISNPLENARRVRFMPQTDDMMANVNAIEGDEDSGLRVGIIWKEGQYDQGGPSDIMSRVGIKTDAEGSTGLLPSDMVPPVDATNCATSVYSDDDALTFDAEDLNNTQAWNLSSNSKAGTNNLDDTTETNNIENALAHRGAIIGNNLYVGYNYSTDWALANYTTLDNYDFWLRRYNATTGEWTTAKNLSNLPTTDVNVREPRFVKTPYSADGTYNPSAFVIAWGSQTNVASHIEDAEDLDIFYTRSFDKGETMEPVVRIENPNGAGRFESQLRPTPNGETVYAVWNESGEAGTESMASVATSVPASIISQDPYDGVIAGYSSEIPSTSSSSSSGGCSVSENAKFDPVLPALLAAALAFLGFRRYSKQG